MIIRWLMLIVAALAIGITLLFVTAMLIANEPVPWVVLFFWLAVLCLLGSMGLMLEYRARGRRAMVVLRYLEQAVRLNLPLPRFLQAAQRQEQPGVARVLERLRTELAAGRPLAEAVAATVPRFPRRYLEALALAEQRGRLAPVLARLVRQRQRIMQRDQGPLIYRSYPVIVLLFLITVIGMLAVFVIPKFEQIARDFQIELPRIMQWNLYLLREFETVLWIGWVALVLVLLARTLGLTWGSHLSEGLPRRTLGQRIFWSLPLMRHVQRDWSLGQAMDAMADALAAGFPADHAVAEAATVTGDPRMRRRLFDWRERLTQGQPLGAAARDVNLPPLVVGMIAAAQDTADQRHVFDFLSRYYRTRFSRTIALLQAAAVPAMVLALGFLVAWVALSLFLSMMAMVDAAMPQWGA